MCDLSDIKVVDIKELLRFEHDNVISVFFEFFNNVKVPVSPPVAGLDKPVWMAMTGYSNT